MDKEDKLTISLRGDARLTINLLADKLETTPVTILEEALTLYESIVQQAEQGMVGPYVREGNSDLFTQLKLKNSSLEAYLQRQYEKVLKTKD